MSGKSCMQPVRYAVARAVALAVVVVGASRVKALASEGAASERPSDPTLGRIVLTDHGPALKLRRRRFSWTLRGRGKLEPIEEANITVETWGIITRMWEDGAPVKKGDVVLELDREDIERGIADREAEVAVREAEFVQTRQKQSKRVKRAEIALKRAELDLEWQRLNRQMLLLGASTEGLVRAEKELEVRRLVESNRTEELAIVEELAERGYATTGEIERKRLQLAEAKLEAEKARIVHKRLLDGPTDLAKKEVELQVRIGEYALESARKTVASTEAASRVADAHAEKRLTSERHELKRDRDRLEKYTIRSPADGYILHVPDRRGNPWAPGRHVWRGKKVMSVPCEGRVKVTTKVAHSDIERIRKDLPCRVRVAARPGESYEGKVVRISSQGRDEFEDLDSFTKDKVAKAGRKTFDVEVELLGEDPSLKPGFRAEVDFLLGEVEGALVVPWGAVGTFQAGVKIGKGRKAYVSVVRGSRVERRKVTLGESDETSVVIESGCEEGDMVLLAYTEI